MLANLSIRWRLAGISALLTFAILCGFAYVIGELTARRIRSDFSNQIIATTEDVASRMKVQIDTRGRLADVEPALDDVAANRAVIRILSDRGFSIAGSARAKALSPGSFPTVGTKDADGFRIATQRLSFEPFGSGFLQYGRQLTDVQATIRRVRLFLLFGVLTGTGLALVAGLMLARRAMAPIAALTATTREIARTRDPNRRVPMPDADDEVAELARTLEEMLQALEASRAESAQMLSQQRRFVADASHELRTPLTSVLANLDLLTETLDGDHREVAASALRSSQRMRRLVADLLLLARQDAKRAAPREPIDLQRVAVAAAAELGPIAAQHDLQVDTAPARVCGAEDELHRVALNLMENAIKHTPPGTAVTVATRTEGDEAVLEVHDDGPGIPAELHPRIFERFVRGEGDRGGSSGLGLAIVRAVTEAHGGSVRLEPYAKGQGTRFTVRLPLAPITVAAEASGWVAPGPAATA